ncbi:Tfp pilus assembly protein FimV [Polymorphobacter multimanifer]|uniref:Tfp pilus assembly protein FimV n=1 Tax=Polymorphobacter multimanifer TaxID=1070431 RepID=A0A841L9I7_9SPHN|nr:Tfp pilus assembly protein FimV [Polymorphobacter multimanifer]
MALITMVDGDSLTSLVAANPALPTDYEGLAFARAAAARADAVEAKVANALARERARDALIAKLKREQYGASAEHTRRLLDQLELQLEKLEADASEDALVAEIAAQNTANVRSFERRHRPKSRFPSICRASGWWCRRRIHARRAASIASPSWARISPTRWK